MKKNSTFSILLFVFIFANTINAQTYDPWVAVTTNGFGNAANNFSIAALKVFDDKIYAGTIGNDTAELFVSSTGNPNDWTLAYSSPVTQSFRTIATVDTGASGGYMFIGGSTVGSNGTVYRTKDGITFQPYYISGFNNVQKIIAFKGLGTVDSIYVCVTNGSSGDQIWKSSYNNNDPSNATGSWTKVFDLNTAGDNNHYISSAVVSNGVLYIGTYGTSPKIYKSTDGKNFSVTAVANNGVDFPGAPNNHLSISSLGTNGTKIYAGTEVGQVTTNNVWVSANGGATWSVFRSCPNHAKITAINKFSFSPEMWISNADIWNYQSLEIFKGTAASDTSYHGNFGHTDNIGLDGNMEFFNNHLYYGQQNSTLGGQLHRLNICFDLAAAASTNNNAPYCKNSTISLQGNASNGLAPYDYHWANVENLDTIWYTQNAQDTLTKYPNMTYHLKVEDANGCITWDTLIINVTNSKHISGNVIYSLGPLTKGMAVLYDTLTMKAKDTSAVTPVGYYQFSNVDAGDYRILIVPDTMYKKLIATYYDSVPLWDSAWVINHGCTANQTIDIKMFEMPILGNGLKASISGRIVEDQGFRAGANRAPGEPISGVSVKVGRKPPGGTNIISTDSTDNNGVYNIDSLPVGTGHLYTVYVDIPGYYRDSTYKFYLTTTNMNSPKHDSMNYRVDSIMIRKDTTSWLNIAVNNIEKYNLNNISVSPNPVIHSANINYSIDKQTKVVVSIYDIRGVKMQELINNEQPAGEHMINFNNDNKLPPGNYFVSLFADGNISVTKMIIIE